MKKILGIFLGFGLPIFALILIYLAVIITFYFNPHDNFPLEDAISVFFKEWYLTVPGGISILILPFFIADTEFKKYFRIFFIIGLIILLGGIFIKDTLDEKFLFSIPADPFTVAELDKGIVSDELKANFEDIDIVLPKTRVDKKNNVTWRLITEDNDTFNIKYGMDELKVYSSKNANVNTILDYIRLGLEINEENASLMIIIFLGIYAGLIFSIYTGRIIIWD